MAALELSNITVDDDATVMQGPMHTGPSGGRDEPEDVPPRSLGRYMIVAELGVGGMGRVLRAYDPQLDREVALKLLRRMSRAATARLLREAQAMAKLCHPNVLPIYDVAAEGPRTFIAMELVRGQSVREWLDTGPHPWGEVLDVFIAAGQGLAAAHAAGLVHRDFKPGNVLLGDDGRVRVMDFGLARGTSSDDPSSLDAASASHPRARLVAASPLASRSASHGRSVELALAGGPADSWARGTLDLGTDSQDPLPSLGEDLTQRGTVVGTPAYMAPEQHLGHTADRRSDQYGFCVALWEALYGQRPFTAEHVDDWYRIKSSSTPQAEPARVVPRWLHAVVLRGLAPRPSDRYPSMPALLHALSHGRRRRRTLHLALVSAVVLGGMGMALHQAGHGHRLCGGAEDALAGVWDEARAAEVEHAVSSSAVSYARDTWQRLAPQLDDYATRWQAAHVEACEATHVRREQSEALMDARMRCLDERRRDLRALVGTLTEADASMVERAVSAVGGLPSIELCADPEYVRAQVPPPSDPTLAAEVATVEEELARIKALVDAGQAKQAEDDAHAALARAEALGYAPLELQARFRLGTVEEELGRYDACKQHFEQTYFDAKREGLDALQARAAIQLIVVLGSRMGQLEEGQQWARFARAALHRAHDPSVEASYLNNAGLLAGDRGDHDAAITHLERALTLREQQLGTDHPLVASVLNNLALMHDAQGRYDEAVALHERALTMRERMLGPQHPHVATSLLNLANVHALRAHHEQALRLQQRALSIYERAYGPDHPHTASALVNLGTTHESLGQPQRALERYTAAMPILERTQGVDHPNVAGTLANLGNVHRSLGDPVRALEHYERALRILEKSLGPSDTMVAIALANMGSLAFEQGDQAQADTHLRRAGAIAAATVGAMHPLTAMIQANQALVCSARGDHDEALELHRQALQVRRELLGARHPDTASSLAWLGVALVEAGEPRAAIEPLEEAIEILGEHDDQDEARHEARFGLARALWEADADRSQARALARGAQAALQQLPGHHAVRPELDAWLDEHDPDGPPRDR